MGTGRPARWLAYEEAIYRHQAGDEARDRIASLERFGRWSRHELSEPAAQRVKRDAVACYRSQLRALQASYDAGTLATVFEPEVIWSRHGSA